MSKKIYVGNLPYSANDTLLAGAFAQCGAVTLPKVNGSNREGRGSRW